MPWSEPGKPCHHHTVLCLYSSAELRRVLLYDGKVGLPEKWPTVSGKKPPTNAPPLLRWKAFIWYDGLTGKLTGYDNSIAGLRFVAQTAKEKKMRNHLHWSERTPSASVLVRLDNFPRETVFSLVPFSSPCGLWPKAHQRCMISRFPLISTRCIAVRVATIFRFTNAFKFSTLIMRYFHFKSPFDLANLFPPNFSSYHTRMCFFGLFEFSCSLRSIQDQHSV